MQAPDISPDCVSISYSFTLIIQLFDAFDGGPPTYILDGIDEIFQEICALEWAWNDGNTQIWARMLYCAHFLQEEEQKNGNKRLWDIFKKIQSIIEQIQSNPVVYEFLWANKMFVNAILSKNI